ncbi:MAG: family 10 glycosylhydrolase [Calothrix sp. C42_A2020_038]|nr:family 10 glycosylhydrolase [Calothrix sp. C42_A2020_038]
MASREIRGVWITTTDSTVLNSKANIDEAMEFLAKTGFNVVFPVVWNQAATQYPSQVMRKTFGVEINSACIGRDPLAEVIEAAHAVGLKVIPWFEYGFASSYNLGGGMLLTKKPEWAARDLQGNLLKKNGFEWLNALDPNVQDFMSNLVLEVVKNYDVDGIQGDDRLPAFPCEGGYDKTTVKLYHSSFGKNPPSNPKDQHWLQWRADILTQFWRRLHQQIKAVNPNLIVAVSPNIHDWAFKEYLQDTPTWLRQGIVDMINPQIYRRDFNSYKSILDTTCQQFPSALPRVAPGILIKLGSYIISPKLLIQTLEYNRSCGMNGEVLFFYEGLRVNNNQLAKVLQKHFYNQSAMFPTISDFSQTNIGNQSIAWWQRLQRFFGNL